MLGASGPFACGYPGRPGRARVSREGVLTFASCRDLKLEPLAEMITATEAGIAAGQRTVT